MSLDLLNPSEDVALANFGQRLAYARKKARLSQAKLAEQVSVTQSSVTQWESGQVVPRMEALLPLSDVLRVSVEWLLGGPARAASGSALSTPVQPGREGLTSLQVATVDALAEAFQRGLVSNDQCLALLIGWRKLIDEAAQN